MAFTIFSYNALIAKILGSIGDGQEIAFLTTLTASCVCLYAKRVNQSTLAKTNTNNGKIAFWMDSNGTFAPTAKTGYKVHDFGFSKGVQYTSSRYVWFSNEDARLQPHDSLNTDNLNNATQQFRYCVVPTSTSDAKLDAWILGSGHPLYHFTHSRFPIYQESYYKTDKFYDPNTPL